MGIASGGHSPALISEMGLFLADPLLWVCETGKHSGLELCFPPAAALLQSAGIIERWIRPSISKETNVGIAHMTEAGITWGEPWHNCCWAWLGERLGSYSPVLYFALLQPVCSAKGSPMHVLVHRGDKMEVISSKGSYKDECTKYSVSCSEDSAKHYSKWRHQLQNSSQSEVTPGIYRWLLRCEWGIFPGLALSLYWFAKGQKLEFSQSCASFLLKSKCLVIWTLGKRKACVIKQTVLLKHKSCN